jgi:hypothetical protein
MNLIYVEKFTILYEIISHQIILIIFIYLNLIDLKDFLI